MKSVERRFNNIAKNNPEWSSYTCFAEAITGQGFSRQKIHRWFNKLVEEDDYTKKEKKEILAYLESISKKVEENQKQREIAHKKSFLYEVVSYYVDKQISAQRHRNGK
jgi:uncharacterized protein with ATP-grasp and redox domains